MEMIGDEVFDKNWPLGFKCALTSIVLSVECIPDKCIYGNPSVGEMLGSSRGDVEKLDEGAFDVPMHGDVDGAGFVTPMEGEPAI
jgi:hypothetical protein